MLRSLFAFTKLAKVDGIPSFGATSVAAGAAMPAASNNSLACNFAQPFSNNGSRPRSFFVSSFTLPTYAILPSSTCSNNSNPPFAYAGSNAEPGCTASFLKPSAFRTAAVNLRPVAADRVSATCCGVSTEICFNHLMPGENGSVGVMISREYAQAHNMVYTLAFCRIDKRFALHKHVNGIASY